MAQHDSPDPAVQNGMSNADTMVTELMGIFGTTPADQRWTSFTDYCRKQAQACKDKVQGGIDTTFADDPTAKQDRTEDLNEAFPQIFKDDDLNMAADDVNGMDGMTYDRWR